MMSGVLMTFDKFPIATQKFLRALPQPRIILPPQFTARINTPIPAQWHEHPRNQVRLTKDLKDALEDFPGILVPKPTGVGRYLHLFGAFRHRALRIGDVPNIISTSWVLLFPENYPFAPPVIWFCWEQYMECDERLRPLRFHEFPYRVPPLHVLPEDESACITHEWDPYHNDTGVFLSWSAQYLARREHFFLTGDWQLP